MRGSACCARSYMVLNHADWSLNSFFFLFFPFIYSSLARASTFSRCFLSFAALPLSPSFFIPHPPVHLTALLDSQYIKQSRPQRALALT